MSHIWISHAIHTKMKMKTYERVVVHAWMSHVTQMNQSFCTSTASRGRWWWRIWRKFSHFIWRKISRMSLGGFESGKDQLKFPGCRVWITDYGILVEDYLCKWFLSNSFTRHVTHEWVMSLIRVGHVMRVKLLEQADGVRELLCHTRMNESSHTFEWVMSHTCNGRGR